MLNWILTQHLGEEPPPLPVPQFEVGSTVPLHDSQSTQLLLPLHEGSDKYKNGYLLVNHNSIKILRSYVVIKDKHDKR